MRTLRMDIQVLRAIAVLSVLIFHFDLPGLNKGFLGVDIFFVISGYLMSRVIVDEMDEGRFSPASFYLRRARRLLPAALVMFTVVTLLAPWALTISALHDYALQLAGGLGFAANVVLWQQSGYFDGEATLKPLLHTWSLALEEQYYFVLPLVLGLIGVIGRRWRALVLIGLALVSFALCQWWLAHDPSGAFYLLPTRAWELLVGSLCALPGWQARMHGRLRFDSAWIGLPLLAAGLIWGVDGVHPRGDAVLVVLSTACLVLMPSALLQLQRAWMRPLHWIGDQSYSLYLVHWPLIALAKNVWLQGVPAWVSWALLPVSFALAQLSYRYVEQPFRRVATPTALLRKLAWILLLLALAAGWMGWHMRTAGEVDWKQLRQPNYGLSANCEFETVFEPLAACRTSAQARTLVWGDSFAMHIVPALVASPPPGGLVQATRSACAPLFHFARQVSKDPAGRGLQCLAFNRSVLAYVKAHPQIEYVVLSARWRYLFDDPVVDVLGHIVKPTQTELATSLADTVKALRRLGRKVILVSPPASIGPQLDLGLCAERRLQGLVSVLPGADQSCGFAQADHERYQHEVLQLLDAVQQRASVGVVRLDRMTCHAGRCISVAQGLPLYRDFGHLSHEGATYLGRSQDLGHIVARDAR
ncbi:MAG TPA: acyltransferase family protein [Aquabacterium sp.]|uniref:acyltransferase family protein n=1 Tax=Aquabacterium sp. TaxID=1872578 RepID=UPI002E2ED2EE|nr:acyltransferase family protein [Aquabacterium sp.]HEX5357421.1 acyltransferase family protein [Aquabacterium sp.]